MTGKIEDQFNRAGIIIPQPAGLEELPSMEDLKKWGWDPAELEKKLFGTSVRGSDGKVKDQTFLSEFDNTTSFMEFGQYVAAPLTGYFGAQIAENMQDTDIIGATAKRAGAKRILNIADRLLETYVLMKLLGGGKNVGDDGEPESPVAYPPSYGPSGYLSKPYNLKPTLYPSAGYDKDGIIVKDLPDNESLNNMYANICKFIKGTTNYN